MNLHVPPIKQKEIQAEISEEYGVTRKTLYDDYNGYKVQLWRKKVWIEKLSVFHETTLEEIFPGVAEKV